ncbi:hypothetical protein E0K89_013280 [Aquicoccus sp. SCR17]|nr:hypothetical protein [Carideicomes alvinocaridis]
MKSDDAFAYVLDEDLVRAVLPDWPEAMGLVLCLSADGRCETVVFHRDEGARALRKAAAVLGRPARSFPVAPAAEGWPTRRVRFSEEQEMLRLVAAAADLRELAQDYAINYRFARDEGLDPDDVAQGRVPGRIGDRSAPEPDRKAEIAREVRRRLHLSLAAEGKRRAPVPLQVGVAQAGAAQGVGMPAGFAPVALPARRECHFASGRIGAHGGNVRITLAPELVTIRTRPAKVEEIGFSPDFSRFYLPRHALSQWKPGRVAILDVPMAQFPDSLRALFGARSFHLEATVTAEGVFLAPGAPLPEEGPAPRRRWLSPRRAAMIGVLGLGTLAGAGVAGVNGKAPQAVATAMLTVLDGAGR